MALSDIFKAGRISAKGMIQVGDLPFQLDKWTPFSIYIRPKSDEIFDADILLDCKLTQDTTYSDCPMQIGAWNVPAINAISDDPANTALFTNYDFYWGTGSEIEN